jgi:hypothetical protein
MPELMVILKNFFAYNNKKLELSVGTYSAKEYSTVDTAWNHSEGEIPPGAIIFIMDETEQIKGQRDAK